MLCVLVLGNLPNWAGNDIENHIQSFRQLLPFWALLWAPPRHGAAICPPVYTGRCWIAGQEMTRNTEAQKGGRI